MDIIIGGWTILAIICIAAALFILYAIGRQSGEADERADVLMAELEREQADMEAWERITR